ncbi:MAG: amylo-alpha-1,6-glucosidase [Ignavibacteria bacterium]|nr:amylo-alpha-1,6-glucosidase [Ignavibacteria bacterium]
MDEVIRVKDQFYILASSSVADEQTRVLKHAETFAVFDRHGDIRPLGFEDHGIYHQGTRFLSQLVLKLEEKNPLLLSSTVKEDNELLTVDLTNPNFESQDQRMIHSGTIHLGRLTYLWESCCYERILMSNYGLRSVAFTLSLIFDADYVDIFEVRGTKRLKRGIKLDTVVEEDHVVLSYRGLDGKLRKTTLAFATKPQELRADQARFAVTLEPHEKATLSLTVSCELEDEPVRNETFDQAFVKNKNMYQNLRLDACVVETSNEQFNDWLNRSRADLYMMVTQTPQGLYPYAGIPWFSTIFGRDGIITALETLWVDPEIARGVLGYLAAHQARDIIPEQDAEPGKILHEERKGEMVSLKEIPFGCYYGTIDATPLFVALAGHYYERTGDRAFIQELWPHIQLALNWIDTYGDVDKDSFVEYERRTAGGLSHQGWKDSEDSIFHADGNSAPPSIALCEVQGYVYDAKLKAARLASMLQNDNEAKRLRREAEALRKKFLKDFWCQELGTYALALDGNKRPCQVKSSNAGQCLFSGIATEEHARTVAQGLLTEDFFTGWGIRTIASSESRYNPISYHNGSIWPHDNALIAFGMSRYGLKDEVVKVLAGLFDASLFVDQHRLPELFCGFVRRPGEAPTLYPVACDPQSWASGSVYLLLQSCLGLSIQAHENKIYFHHPALPTFLQEVSIKNLKVGSACVDIELKRHEQDVGVNVRRREGDIEVVVTK